MQRNSIVYLPTGSGKSLIATLAINHFRHELTKPIQQNGRRAVLLVNTVVLAMQHTEGVKEHLGLEVACWTSETKKKSWSKQKCEEQFDKHSIIVATAQLFVDAVKHSFISIEQLCIIIFDECHHARLNHPYHELMKQFQYVNLPLHPRVIGLSGLLVGISSSLTKDNIEDELKTLESTFMATIVTVNKLQDYKNVLLHSTNPKESFVRYHTVMKGDLSKELVKRIDQIRWDLSLIKVNNMQEKNPASLHPTRPRKLKEVSNLFEEVKNELDELGVFGAYLALKAIRVQYGLIKKKPQQNRQFLQVVNKCISYVDQLTDVINDELDFDNLTSEKIFINSSTKVRALIRLIILKFNACDRIRDLQCLVFVERRYSAKCLYHLLRFYAEHEPTFCIIKPDFVVGINGEIPESIEDIMSINSNKLALDKFRDKITNLICSSSVLEEGIDLQMCNLVIMFSAPTTFRCYLQTMGRARVRNSDYIFILRDENVDDYKEKLVNYNEIDVKLKRILIEKTCDRKLTAEDIEKEQLEVWQPLITEQRAICNNLSAVALLNRLLSRYANTNLLWSREESGPQTIAILELPAVLNIKPRFIKSDPFSDIKLAKQHAAFKACELLFNKGLLDVNLIPKCN